MENLKISFYLSTPAILNRFTTIDAILLKAYYTLNQPSLWVQPSPDNIDFIYSKHGVFSGSIWYVDSKSPVFRDRINIVKTIEDDKYIKYTKGPSTINHGSGPYKAYRIDYDTIFTTYIYFYIKGNYKTVSKIARSIRAIGKKQSIGYGQINKVKINRMPEDKGFMLSPGNPSRPLTFTFTKAKTNRIAYYRVMPPYYLKNDRYICYMPCSSLYETVDPPVISDSKVSYPFGLSASELACKSLKLDTVNLPKIKHYGCCNVCGKPTQHILPIRQALKKSSNFNDYPYIKGSYICNYCLSIMQLNNMRKSGNFYIDNFKTIKLIGKNSIDKADRDKFIRNLDDNVKPPYIICLKSIRNNQHVVWKSTVGISNAIVPIQIGNQTLFVDTAMLKQAIAEMDAVRFRKISAMDNSYRYTTDSERKYLSKYDDSVLKILKYVIPKTGENL